MITRACSVGTAIVACGLASAMSSTASAEPYPSTATWRRQPGAPRGDGRQQLRGRERVRAALGARVERDEERDQREADQEGRVGEAHLSGSTGLRAGAGRRRAARTRGGRRRRARAA